MYDIQKKYLTWVALPAQVGMDMCAFEPKTLGFIVWNKQGTTFKNIWKASKGT